MFDRLSASFALARSSWQVLRTDKQLVLFPILSGIGCFFVLASFALPFVAHPQWLDFLDQRANQGLQIPPWAYAVVFAFYFCNYFVIVFFNSALISCALIRFNGGAPTLADGLNAAVSRLPQILAWAAVSATVGVLLKVIENANEKVGRFVSSILGTAWTIVTYFVVPVLVVERAGPFEAVKRSIAILRKTWGEALIGHMGIGFFMFLLMIPGFLLVFAGIFLTTYVAAAGLAVLALALVYFPLMAVVGSALNGIFLGALYQYAVRGQAPSEFDSSTMRQAFYTKA